MKRDADSFGDVELALVYVARTLRDALTLEEVLTAAGVDYVVEADRYWVGTLFRRERVGAFFYVEPERETSTRDFLRDRGYKPFDGDAAS